MEELKAQIAEQNVTITEQADMIAELDSKVVVLEVQDVHQRSMIEEQGDAIAVLEWKLAGQNVTIAELESKAGSLEDNVATLKRFVGMMPPPTLPPSSPPLVPPVAPPLPAPPIAVSHFNELQAAIIAAPNAIDIEVTADIVFPTPIAVAPDSSVRVFSTVGATLSGNGSSAIFTQGHRSVLSLEGLRLAHGSSVNGAAVSMSYAILYAEDCTFIENVADGLGGAVFCNTFGSSCSESPGEPCEGNICSFERCTFTHNQAGNEGGAVRVYNGRAAFSDCHFHNNYAVNDGDNVKVGCCSASFVCSSDSTSMSSGECYSCGGQPNCAALSLPPTPPPPPPPPSPPVCSNACFAASDDDCDDGSPGSAFAYCELGTDCIDCGGDPTVPAPPSPPPPSGCSNTCLWSSDGDCDDGSDGAPFPICELGTDCIDCGLPAVPAAPPGPSPPPSPPPPPPLL